MVRTTFLGGASEIGGSCTLVEAFGLRVVVDVGMRPKSAEAKFPDLERVAAAGVPHALVVTHAHIDHVGGLPLFHRRFPGVPIYGTTPTLRLGRLMLHDSVGIMERDWEGDAHFTTQDVDALARVLITTEFRAPVVVASSTTARCTAVFFRSGHIMGAATVVLEFESRPEGESGPRHTACIVLSGDVSDFPQRTIPGADLEALRGLRPDLFVCEGTYGAEEHRRIDHQEALLAKAVAATLARGGRVVIPVFAVGRAQNILLILRHAHQRPEWFARLLGEPFEMPDAPIYVDGLARAVTDQYASMPEFLQPDVLHVPAGQHPFYAPINGRRIVQPVKSSVQQRELLDDPTPAVFIASSGMLTGGASAAYARAIAGDPKSAIFLAGYQDEESPGGIALRLARASEAAAHTGDSAAPVPEVAIGGIAVPVRCAVEQYGLSAHLDATGVERMLEMLTPRRMVLVHGTPLRLGKLRARLERFVAARSLDTTVEVSHQDEPIECAVGERSRRPRFAVTPSPDHWELEFLTGRTTRQDLDPSPGRPFVTTALRFGRDRVLTDAEFARLETLVPAGGTLPADLLLTTTDGARAAGNAFWHETRHGAERTFRPVHGATASIQQANENARRQVHHWVGRAIRSAPGLEEHWARVRALGVRRQDLILYVSSIADTLRLLPAVTTEETAYGFEILGPHAPESAVAVPQIVARVGPWVSPVVPGVSTDLIELRTLDLIGRALAAFPFGDEVTQLRAADDPGTPAVDERPRMLEYVWLLAEQGELQPESAFLASRLLTRHGPRFTVTGPVARFAALLPDRVASHAAAVICLRDLHRSGLVSMHDAAGGGVTVRWSVQRVDGLRASPEAQVSFATLGPGFESLLRRAVRRAVAEVEHLGVTSQLVALPQASDDPLGAARRVGPSRRVWWLAPPTAPLRLGARSTGEAEPETPAQADDALP